MGGQYGPYVMYFLSQLLQKQQAMAGTEQKEKNEYFSRDETAASWHRQEDVEILKKFCREGYTQARPLYYRNGPER